MKTDHINHVVLYAKNFYRHSGDVVKDLQRFCQLDGIPFYKIKTPEKLLGVMLSNYNKWVKSLPDERDRKYKDKVEGVRWEDDPVKAKLYSILISYNGGYITMNSHNLKPPVYDKYHLPQYNVTPKLFNKGDSFEQMNKAAKDFLEKTFIECLDEYANRFLQNFDWEYASEFAAISGKPATGKELEDEWWDAYNSFVETHENDDNTIAPDVYTIFTPHFDITINTKNEHVDIETDMSVRGWHYETDEQDSEKAAAYFRSCILSEPKEELVGIARKLADRMTSVPEHLFSVDDLNEHHKEMITPAFLEDEYYKEHGVHDVRSGCYMWHLKKTVSGHALDIHFQMIGDCEIRENSLWNYRNFGDAAY